MSNWWPELKAVREAADRGELSLGFCDPCGRAHYYPRAVCPYCLSPATRRAASGEGVVYSLTVLRRGPDAPSGVLYVTLSEGVTVLGRLEPKAIDAVSIGDAVRFSRIDQTDEGLVPVFMPHSG